jgi:hypothetical protein
MEDQEDAVWPHPRLDEIAVLPCARDIEAELIAPEVTSAAEEEAAKVGDLGAA